MSYHHLFDAIQNNDYESLSNSLDQLDCHINYPRKNQLSLLVEASIHGNPQIVKLLLEKGANVNDCVFASQESPLYLAAVNNRLDTVKILLDFNANIESRDRNRQTPLMAAARNGYDAIVGLLLDKKAKVDAKDKKGITALHLAARYNYEKTATILINHAATVDIENKKGKTPLILAVHYARGIETTKLLLENGADIEKNDSYGRNAYDYAKKLNRHKALELMAVVIEEKQLSSMIDSPDQQIGMLF